MSDIVRRIQPASKDIGFVVRRLLPAIGTRSIGPFVFLDHMGPAHFAAEGTAGDVRQHPHIGLATVTYLRQGEMMHRDSLGTEQRITPGDINLMVAGRGIVHSERVPADIRQAGQAIEGLQMWLALPQADEACEPSFHHYTASTLPTWQEGGARLQLLIGNTANHQSPVRTFAPTLYLSWQLAAGASLTLPAQVAERGLYLFDGSVQISGETIQAGELLVLGEQASQVSTAAGASGVLFGGAPLDGARYLDWNFVTSDRNKLQQARDDWANGRFAMVKGESEFIPQP